MMRERILVSEEDDNKLDSTQYKMVTEREERERDRNRDTQTQTDRKKRRRRDREIQREILR